MCEWEETPTAPQGLEREGSAGITPKGRRGNGWRLKHNFDDDHE